MPIRNTRVVELRSSATQSVGTATTEWHDVSDLLEGQLLIDVTAETAAATLDITIQTSDNADDAYTHSTVSQITATGKTRVALTNFGKYVRLSAVLAGSGADMTWSATFVGKN